MPGTVETHHLEAASSHFRYPQGPFIGLATGAEWKYFGK
jgi:hypothetical protein